MSAESPWMLLADVVKYARSSRTEILAALADGSLRGHQRTQGGKWRVHREDVDSWLRGEPPAPIADRIRARAS